MGPLNEFLEFSPCKIDSSKLKMIDNSSRYVLEKEKQHCYFSKFLDYLQIFNFKEN
jgi:hypothetical protein